jgi:FecR protein
MIGKLKNLRLAALLVLASAAVGATQTNSTPAQRPDAIHPGEVNYVEGQVTLNGNSLQSTSALRSTVIQPGGDLSTGQGFAEVLLSPGAFLRVGNNSEVRLVSAGLVDSRVALVRGSALLEAADVVKGTSLNVELGNSTARITDKGLYSFDAGQQTVKVFDGKLKLTEGAAGETTLKKGDQVILSSNQPLKKRDFNKKAAQEDPLYVWSKVRSHDEAEASISVADRVASSGAWYGPGWYWDPAWSFYAFAPGVGYLGSPFGWNYYSPGFVYGGYGYWGRGVYNRGYYPGRLAAGRTFHGGMGQVHSMGGVRSMGGFRGGVGGFHGGATGGHR